ncbi:MAG: hypothetical protein JWO48_3494 [Bryobacterales bacterium]|nr:hypothetical protein [Bryobacterales bacterium]
MAQITSPNFGCLAIHDAQIVRLGTLAERYFTDDPVTCLIKLRQYGEALAQLVAAKAGLFRDSQELQTDLLRRLRFERVVPPEVADLCELSANVCKSETVTLGDPVMPVGDRFGG